jgi:hypothetical protein
MFPHSSAQAEHDLPRRKNRKSLVGFADATLAAMNALTSVAPPKPKANLCLAQQG